MAGRAQLARSIRLCCGEEAYFDFKYHNVVPVDLEEKQRVHKLAAKAEYRRAKRDGTKTPRQTASENKARETPVYQLDHKRRDHMLRHHGVTPEQYDAMLAAQEGRCAICRTDDPGRGNENFCIDHCHETGEVRGLLCNSCNLGTGHLQDSPQIVAAAIKYLLDFEARR